MKNDPFFKFTAAVILAGVVAAFASSDPKPATPTTTPPAALAAWHAPASAANAGRDHAPDRAARKS